MSKTLWSRIHSDTLHGSLLDNVIHVSDLEGSIQALCNDIVNLPTIIEKDQLMVPMVDVLRLIGEKSTDVL